MEGSDRDRGSDQAAKFSFLHDWKCLLQCRAASDTNRSMEGRQTHRRGQTESEKKERKDKL